MFWADIKVRQGNYLKIFLQKRHIKSAEAAEDAETSFTNINEDRRSIFPKQVSVTIRSGTKSSNCELYETAKNCSKSSEINSDSFRKIFFLLKKIKTFFWM